MTDPIHDMLDTLERVYRRLRRHTPECLLVAELSDRMDALEAYHLELTLSGATPALVTEGVAS